MSDRFFFQDFLFEDMPVDEQDNPQVEIRILPTGSDMSLYKTVSFDTMLRMNKRKEWEDLYEQTKGCDVCIKDDVLIENTEMEPYKYFYLKAYYFCLLKHSKNLYVVM